MPKATAAYLFLAGFLASSLFWTPVEARAAESAPVAATASAEPTVADLVKTLSSNDTVELFLAIQALAAKGPEAAPAVPDLIKILGDDKRSNQLRVESAHALGEIGPAAKDAVPVLLETVKARESALRGYSAKALGCIGPDAAAAVKPLAVLVRDSDPAVRLQAARALGAIKSSDAESIEALELAKTNASDRAMQKECEAALRSIDDAKRSRP